MALAVAVRPSAATAVIVNVVVPLTLTVADPDVATAIPLIEAETALVLDQFTAAVL